ncbi:hypothetical protein D9611_002719 [Ephemerocybe angulata]|uniref:Uncharacterized protein n=1 Tax=Ephemerocybe angulata TaxID=980116 RepID=A0A8H5C1Y7_9AGAR|nr:hypothetical protein D9611_002719 [Tulosesus angulatus]
MIPLIPALVLAFLSFFASVFVVLRIVIPILPPSPLSRRVSPSEFGLPAFRSLAPADKAHLWLTGFDLFALTIFIWQVVTEATSGPSAIAIASDPLSAVRIWLLMTSRHACLFVVACITLLHVRMGRSIVFGKTHWMLWAPVVLLGVTSTALAGVMSGAGVYSLFQGLAAYNGALALLTTAMLTGLFVTLYAIKRNLASLNAEEQEPWPPVQEAEEKGRPSFGTEEIDAIKDGASWITSNPGSRRNSGSAWSFSTHHTAVASSMHSGRPQKTHSGSGPAKSSYWFSPAGNDELVPPVPPLPSGYGTSETLTGGDPDPFRRDLPPLSPLPVHPRGRLDSQTSWMTSTQGSRTTVPAWSFPGTDAGSLYTPSVQDFPVSPSRPLMTPALATAQVLGGYGFGRHGSSEEGLSSLAAAEGADVEISPRHVIGWFISVWLPLALSFPYLTILALQGTPSTAVYVFYALSVTLSSPLLALNLLCKAPLPIPNGLFDRVAPIPFTGKRLSTTPSELPAPYKFSHEYKRSMSSSPTVVEGRRSGDVWITNGDAVNGKSKLGRAISMLSPQPKLSVIPPEELHTESPPLPPVPIPDEDSLPVNIYTHNRSQSENSAQFGRMHSTKTTRSSRNLSTEEGHATRIMVAQRHYSTLAQTVVVSPGGSSDNYDSPMGSATGVVVHKPFGGAHLRARSVSTVSGPQTPTGSSFGTTGSSFGNDISPPPPFPLPPTPPSVRAARLAQMSHKKSFSSSYSFSPVQDVNEIDALTAGVLPILIPGLTVGEDMKIMQGGYTPPCTFSKSKGGKAMMKMKKMKEFDEDFSSPELHSTPVNTRRGPRARKVSHKKNHFSLPSLGLGKEGMQSLTNWSTEIRGAFDSKVGNYMAIPSNVDLGYRNTVFGAESIPNNIPHLENPREQKYATTGKLTRGASKRSMGLRADVPVSARSSANYGSGSGSGKGSTLPPSAASTVTLFEEFEAELESNPQTHSTPHNTVTGKPSRQPAPPMPPNRRSSIVYIRSEETTGATTTVIASESTDNGAQGQSARSSIGQWSARAVRPLIPKNSLKKLRIKTTGIAERRESTSLRQLTLLQDKDTNSIHSVSSHDSTGSGSTRPLTLGKRQKTRKMTVSGGVQDENAVPSSRAEEEDVVGSLRGIKPLKLARSETSKQRAVLRKNEVLPDVVVRPPSMSEHTPFAYTFRAE